MFILWLEGPNRFFFVSNSSFTFVVLMYSVLIVMATSNGNVKEALSRGFFLDHFHIAESQQCLVCIL